MIVILVKMDHEAKMKGAGESETLKKKLRSQSEEPGESKTLAKT